MGWVLLALAAVCFSGCKTTPKIDWDTRVGNYNYDQAVVELGPPDRSMKLSDGNTVAEWITRNQGGGFSFGVGTGMYGSHSAVGVGQTVTTGARDKVLRLIFNPENKLVSWWKNF